MGRTVVNRKYLCVAWGDYTWATRKYRFRHQRHVHNIYVQVGPLEVVVWYR